MDELDNILEGEEQPVEGTPQEPVEQQAEPETQPRDDTGKFAPKGEEGVPPAPEDKAKAGQEAAIVAERRKRQEAEERVTRLEQQFAALQQPQEPQAPPPSIWDDEEAWQNQFGGKVVSTAVEQSTYQSKLQMSQMMATQAHPDFDEVWEPMNQFLTENPAVIQQVQNNPHPWDAAYKAYKNSVTLKELGATDVESLKAKLREEIEAEKKTPQIPQSLAGMGGRPQAPPATGGEMSIDDILNS